MKVGIYHTLGDDLGTGAQSETDALEASLEVLVGAARGGATLLEVGLPFSDPLLDGPVIQASHGRALARGEFTWSAVCAALTKLRSRAPDAQISVMTSAQLLYTPARRAELPPVDGLLLTDVDALAATPFPLPSPRVWFLSQDVALRADLTPPRQDVSMVYLTRLQGVTGEGQSAAPETKKAVARIRAASPATPIWLGFGVSSRNDVVQAAEFGVDGVVIGSAFVRSLAGLTPRADLAEAAARWVKGVLPALTWGLAGAGVATALSLAAGLVAPTRAHAQEQAQAPEARRLNISYTVDWINQGAWLSPREEELNPNNVARVPTWTLLSQVRPDAKVEFGRRLTLVARPRISYSYAEIDSSALPFPGSPRERKQQGELTRRWQEAFGTLMASEALSVTYGVQNYQWGSGESFSPTNPLYPEPQFDRGLYSEFEGQEMLRMNLSAGQWGSLVLLGKPAQNDAPDDEGSLVVAKAELAFNNGSDSVGLVGAGGERRLPGFGELFSYNLTDAILVFGEAFHTKQGQGLEIQESTVALPNPAPAPGVPSPSTRVRTLTRKGREDDLRTTATAGFRYGFSDGSEFRVEGLFNESGLTRSQLRDTYATLRDATPVALQNVGELLAVSQRFLAREAVFGSVRVIDLPPARSLTFYARATVFPQDASYVALASMEFAWKDDTTLFGTFLHADHRKDTFAMNFAREAGTAGVKVTW